MNILLLLAHSIEEEAQVRLLTSLGYNVFSIGAYTNPTLPGDDKRDAVEAPYYEDLAAACEAQRIKHEGELIGARIDWAKADLADEVIEWADVIICHHMEHQWLVPQWERIRHKRVIWRTIGQSVQYNEVAMTPLRNDGLERIAYSPREENIPGYCGHDALIRFYADPDVWRGWTGEDQVVMNHSQNLKARDPYTNYRAWECIGHDLPRRPVGPGSEDINGTGPVSLNELQRLLRASRCYLYTGTQPASYTLALVEAMMTGIPVVSIGPEWHDVFPYGPMLFEGYELAGLDVPTVILQRRALQRLLVDPVYAKSVSQEQRGRALELFGIDKIGKQWRDYLGKP